jgi:hypothetical protein
VRHSAAGAAAFAVAAFRMCLAATFFVIFRALARALLAVGACWALAASAASALTLAQRLLVASTMAFLPAALSLRIFLGGSGATMPVAARPQCGAV